MRGPEDRWSRLGRRFAGLFAGRLGTASARRLFVPEGTWLCRFRLAPLPWPCHWGLVGGAPSTSVALRPGRGLPGASGDPDPKLQVRWLLVIWGSLATNAGSLYRDSRPLARDITCGQCKARQRPNFQSPRAKCNRLWSDPHAEQGPLGMQPGPPYFKSVCRGLRGGTGEILVLCGLILPTKSKIK